MSQTAHEFEAEEIHETLVHLARCLKQAERAKREKEVLEDEKKTQVLVSMSSSLPAS